MEATQQSLDSTQYTEPSILQYEMVYGEDFVAPGGRDMALELITRMSLPPGSKVLDVGCGLGGSAFVMAQQFDLRVEGIDLSSNMIKMAQAKLIKRKLESKVSLRLGDCMKLDQRDYYDAIYSRDVFLHIQNKQRLFDVLYKVLKQGGKLLFTDYCCGEKPWEEEFSTYVRQRDYNLHTLDIYAKLIDDAGFIDVVHQDLTTRFVDILQHEIQKIESSNLDQSIKQNLVDGWKAKVHRADAGDQKWGLFIAVK